MTFRADDFSYRLQEGMRHEYKRYIAEMMCRPWPASIKTDFEREMHTTYQNSNTKTYVDRGPDAIVYSGLHIIGWFAVKLFHLRFSYVNKSDLKGVWLEVREAIDKDK